MKTQNQPFGLKIAVKYALEAIQDSLSPTSVVFSNLLFLQKSEFFPKNLDKQFFAQQKYQPNDIEKKIVVKLLDEIKKPHASKQEMLESVFEQGWVKKKAPPMEKVVVKPTQKKKPVKKTNIVKKTSVKEPTIVVKKSKLG